MRLALLFVTWKLWMHQDGGKKTKRNNHNIKQQPVILDLDLLTTTIRLGSIDKVIIYLPLAMDPKDQLFLDFGNNESTPISGYCI